MIVFQQQGHSRCEDLRTNNQILRQLVVTARDLSIDRIEEGKDDDLTVKQIEDFYDPTIKRIDSVRC